MIKCPFCNQSMGKSDSENNSYEDLYRCGACEVEKSVYWYPGEQLSDQKSKE